MVGCWGTRVVFLMANQRSTRVQIICKKLQTVRGAGWPAAWALSWLLEIFFKGEIPGLQGVLWGRGGKVLFRGDFLELGRSVLEGAGRWRERGEFLACWHRVFWGEGEERARLGCRERRK